MPLSQEDVAEELIALFQAMGAVNVLNDFGTVTSTAANVIPDPTTAAFNKAVLSTSAASAFTLPAPAQGKRFRLMLTQDGTGSRTAAFTTSAGDAIKWVGGAAPTLTTTAARIDMITFECFNGTGWFGSSQLNIA
jgi:hypothetical protein